jgi:integrase
MHPSVVGPDQWTRELAAEYVAAVERSTIGQWTHTDQLPHLQIGKPHSPRSKGSLLSVLRSFLLDCQDWNWTQLRFDPRRYLATPRSITSLIRTNPRVINDGVWAKLLWAGLNLTAKDFSSHTKGLCYPLKMIQAMVIVWLFAGLRSDEICRLRLGCVRWQKQDVPIGTVGGLLRRDSICWLDVPVNKTSPAFTKPVDLAVGEAITEWEKGRAEQPSVVDPKTSEVVHFLFSYRGVRVSKKYINRRIIPLLCRKAGVPAKDARGNITSHRARSTIASLLFNAKEPMSLFELQEWLGHSSPHTTQYYAKITPTKLAKSYAEAGYFERNIRTIKVLIDHEVIRIGAAAAGEPWKFYDLGHGYCTYDFFDQCPHRMACAKCSFYLPKDSTKALLLEGRTNLLRMMQEIPLTDDERSAVEDGLVALGKLTEKLADTPAPDGRTPKQLIQITKPERPGERLQSSLTSNST